MKTNVQVHLYTENKILEILTKCVKTLIFSHYSFIAFVHIH